MFFLDGNRAQAFVNGSLTAKFTNVSYLFTNLVI